jgi:TGF-beta propeptide
MKRLTAKTRLVSLLGLLVFLWSAAYAQITPSADSYTNTVDPTTNYGAKTLLDVDGASQITYIQFNLASIPTTASISQATLKLYVNGVTTAGSFNVDYINSAWAENTIDSSNAPPLGTTIASNVNVTTAEKNQYILINVTTAVQAWLSGSETNNGLALVANSTFNATFDSKENTTTSHAPELDIAFAGGEGTITGVTTASGSGLTGGGTSGTLNLSLTNACATNQVLQWNGSAWACSSAGNGTITSVTAGTDLTGGGTSGAVTLNLDTSRVPLLVANNSWVGNQDVLGNVSAFAVSGLTVTGTSVTAGVYGVSGINYATSGQSNGVVGQTSSPLGSGTVGINNASSGFGVYGQSNGTAINTAGVYGTAAASSSNATYGVWGETFSTNASSSGVYGVAGSGYGVVGTAGSSGVDGLHGETSSQYSGVAGLNFNSTGGYGVFGQAFSPGGIGGGFYNSSTGDALFAYNQSGGYAAFFDGNVDVDGNLSKAGGSFKIDHPLDPANKYLYHSFVESPDMKNIYDGVATLDASGEALIEMPEWFGVLNRDFRYQITCIGGFAPVYIAEKLTNNQFKIGGGKPGMEVSWQITGIRQDAWANAHRIPVEEEKDAKLKGFYLHPELYGAPAEKQIEWARHPGMMKKLQQNPEPVKEKQARLIQSAAQPDGAK